MLRGQGWVWVGREGGGQPAVVAKYRGEMNRRISKCQLGVHTMSTLCTMYIYKKSVESSLRLILKMSQKGG